MIKLLIVIISNPIVLVDKTISLVQKATLELYVKSVTYSEKNGTSAMHAARLFLAILVKKFLEIYTRL